MQHAYSRFWRLFGLAALSVGLLTVPASPAAAQWVTQNTNFPANFTGVGDVEVVDANVVWITGFDGSGGGELYNDFARTIDGGTTWTPNTVGPGAGLTFANISAASATTAWAAMLDPSVGGGRIFRTVNGGTAWTRQLTTGFPVAQGGFLDAVRMYSATNGIVLGDPITPLNEFEVYTTTTGGDTWTLVPAADLPNPITGEYGFLDGLAVQGASNAWFGTSKGRVYRSTTGGTSWTVATTGLAQVNNLAFSSATDGLAMELDNTGSLVALARTSNGGVTWNVIAPSGPVYTSDLQPIPGAPNTFVTAGARAGNQGSSVTTDGGFTWANLQSSVQRTAIGAANANNVWAGSYTASGAGGIVKGNLTPSASAAPEWEWAQGPGANATEDAANGTTTDAAGNVYVAGRFSGTATFGTITITSGGDQDGYLAKYNSAGVVQWARRFGGTDLDLGRDVAVDANGNVFVAGLFRATASFGTQTVTSAGDADAFVAKYSAAGDIIWVRAGGGTLADVAYQVGVDGAGNAYISGAFSGTATFSGTALVSAGGIDAYVASYTDAGALRWARRGGSDGDEYAIGLGVTSAGDVTIGGPFGPGGTTGQVGSAIFGTITVRSIGGSDGYVARYDNAGTIQWVRSFGSINDDGPNSIAVDALGNVYVAGYFRGDITFGNSTVSAAKTFNVLVLSYSASGAPRWAKRGGGDIGDSGYQITTDRAGNAYVTGFFQGPATFGSVTFTSENGADVMVVKYLSATGAVEWGTSAAGDGNEFGRGIAVDATGNVYVSGSFDSPVLTFNSLVKRNRVGGIDGYLAKLRSSCSLTAPLLSASGPVCVGQTLTLSATAIPTGATVQWYGPNGFSASTATAIIPDVTAAATGLYTVIVSSAAQGCSRTASLTVTVETPPAAPTATTTFRRCGPGTLTLTVQGSANGTYFWYTAATGGSPIAGATGGSYTTPSLTATTTYYVSARNAAGCESERTAVVANVESGPVVSVTANGPTSFCSGGSVVLTASAPGAVSYLWSSGATTAQATFTVSGSYTVTATNAAGCPTTSTATVVTLTPAPAAPTATGASRCGTGSVTLTASGRPAGGIYKWYSVATGGSPIAGATGATYTTPSLSATTTYYVSTATASGCESPRVAATATVTALPNVMLTAAGPTTFCDGGTVVLRSGGTSGVTYQFARNGVAITGATGSTYSATQSGSYTVVGTSVGGCDATSVAVTVTVTPAANATFAYASNTICLGATATAAPTISGTTGGTFTITPTTGVTINASTGVLTLTGATAGTYTVRYAVNGLCPANSTQVVTLTTAPAATFTYAQASFCIGTGLTAAPTLAIGAGAGTFSAPAGLSINATTGVINLATSAPGTYVVTNALAASGSCPAARATTMVSVTASPTAPTVTGASRCGTGTVALTAADGAANGSYNWYTVDTGGSPIAGATGATYTTPAITATTTYYVSTSSAGGCESPRVAVTATVTALPTVALVADGPTTFCAGGTVVLTASGTPGVTFQFALNGAPIVGATGTTYSASQSGQYTVIATSTSTCEATSTPVVVTVNALPTVALTASGPTTFCDGNMVVLTAAGSAGATYQFTRNGTPIAGATSATYDVSQSGDYAVIATTAASCEAISTAVTVTVNPLTTATFAYAAPTFCLGSTASVTPTIGGTAGGTFSVSPATGVTIDPTTGVLTLTGATAGNYTITYAVSGPCPSTSSQDVALSAAPLAGFSYAQASYCTAAGTSATPALATGAAAGAFSATPSGLALDAATGVIDLSASTAGTYSVVNALAASGVCGAVSDSTTVIVVATPAAPTVSPTNLGALVQLTSSAPTGNQWYRNGVLIVGATDQTYTVTAAAQNGVYTVVATTGACPSVPSAGVTVTVTGLAAELAKAAQLALYPNPTADGRVTLELAASPSPTALTVFDAAGRAVLRATLPANTTRYELDAHNLPVGVYAVRVGVAVRRLVRE